MTGDTPTWLPSLVEVSGDWDVVLQNLHAIYQRDFVVNSCKCETLLVLRDCRVLDGKFEECFWHLITKGKGQDRTFDSRRAERLPWCKPVLQNSPDSSVTTWKYEEGDRRIRRYLWLKDLDYVVILEVKRKRLFLVTAYYIDGENSRKSLDRKRARALP